MRIKFILYTFTKNLNSIIMKPTMVRKSGKKLFYLDMNENLIQIGDTIKVDANSGRNYGTIRRVEGVLEEIDTYGNFIVNGESLNTMCECLYMKGANDEVWFKCFHHSTNGYKYSVEIVNNKNN